MITGCRLCRGVLMRRPRSLAHGRSSGRRAALTCPTAPPRSAARRRPRPRAGTALLIWAPKLGVVLADGDVVEDDVAVGMPAGGCDGPIQQEPGPGVGAALHDKQGRASRQPFDSPVFVAHVLFLIGWSWPPTHPGSARRHRQVLDTNLPWCTRALSRLLPHDAFAY
jgi:hypothetical protein